MVDEQQASARVVKPKEIKRVGVDKIIVGHRYREDLGDVEALSKSIEQSGLLHPIVVKETLDNKYQLMAGARRLEACKLLGWKEIVCNIYPSDLEQLDRNIIELCENIDRKDMSFEEQVALTKQIHLAMQKKFGRERVKGTQYSKTHSVRDTAKLLNSSVGGVSDDIQLATAIEAIPELGKAKNKAEAMKMLRSLKRKHDLSEATKIVDKRRASTPEEKMKKDLISSYIIGDFFEGVKNIPSDSIDLVEVDTPYAINLEHNKKIKLHHLYRETQMREYNEWEMKTFLEKSGAVLKEAYRVLNDRGWLIWWFAPDYWFSALSNLIEESGFLSNNIPAVWEKASKGQTLHPDLYLANSYEVFFYARKGEASIKKQGRSNVFSFKRVNSDSKSHPTEKPIELMSDIFSTFTLPDSRIMIPFLGSGNSILAAHNVGCTAFGWDLSQQYKDRFIEKVMNNGGDKFKSYRYSEG